MRLGNCIIIVSSLLVAISLAAVAQYGGYGMQYTSITSTSTSTTTTVYGIINGTTSIAFVICTTTVFPPLWNTSIMTTSTSSSTSTTIVPPSQCYSSEYFYCLYPFYSSDTGNLSVETGQGIGLPGNLYGSEQNWTNVYVVFVPKGTKITNGIPDVSFSIPNAAHISVLHSGFGYNVELPVSAPGTTPGTKASGSIWVKYNVLGSNVVQYLQITTINMTAVPSPQSYTTGTTTSSETTTAKTSLATTIPTSTVNSSGPASSSSSQNSNNPISALINYIISFLKSL